MIALKNCWREDKMLELYNWTFQNEGEKNTYCIFMWNQNMKEQILYVNTVQFTILIINTILQ